MALAPEAPEEWSPQACRELILAVIDLAVEDARGRHGAGEAAVARAWLFDEERRPGSPPEAGTFAWYAELLGIDPTRARRMLKRRLELQHALRFPGRPYSAGAD